MFSREENTWSLSTAGMRAADCRTQVTHRGRSHSQMPTLQRSWGKEEWWSLKQALKSHCSQSDTCTRDRNWGSSQPILPAHAGDGPGLTAAHGTVPTALPRLHSRESPSSAITRCDRGCGQRSHSQQAQQHQHSLQGAASHDSSMPCLQLFRKKLCLFIIRNTSEYTHPFWNKVSLQGNTQVQKHMTPASSLLQGLQTGKGRSARMRGKNILLYFRKIQMGDKAEMKTGGSLLSKHNINPAINHTHANVKTTQEFPDTEEKVMRGMQMLSAIAWTQMRNI